jgi:GAF domain-containing protein
VSYRQNRSFDDAFGYRTKSMLVLPMKSHRDEIVGVLQLINRKRAPDMRLMSDDVVEREVLTYDQRCVELTTALASQAAVAIENGRLYEDIDKLFASCATRACCTTSARSACASRCW